MTKKLTTIIIFYSIKLEASLIDNCKDVMILHEDDQLMLADCVLDYCFKTFITLHGKDSKIKFRGNLKTHLFCTS